MDISITILRQLWRLRVAVSTFALLSILIGALLAFRPTLPPQSRKYHVGAAHVHILIDTPASQVVEIDPKGSDSLGSRASLLSNLMVEGDVKAAIARRAGLRPDQLVALSDAAVEPATVAPAQLEGPKALLLKTTVVTNDAGGQLPIIGVETQAPDALRATALANAAVAGLRDYLDTKAALEAVPDARRLQVRGLGSAQGHELARGPGALLAGVVTVFVFALLCTVLLAVVSLVRGWRAASAQEAGPPRAGELDAHRAGQTRPEVPSGLWIDEPPAPVDAELERLSRG
jgi:hypothetical protein